MSAPAPPGPPPGAAGRTTGSSASGISGALAKPRCWRPPRALLPRVCCAQARQQRAARRAFIVLTACLRLRALIGQHHLLLLQVVYRDCRFLCSSGGKAFFLKEGSLLAGGGAGQGAGSHSLVSPIYSPIMSDTEDGRERERSQEPAVRENPRREEPSSEFKVFVGGISWQLDDHKLKESERSCWPL